MPFLKIIYRGIMSTYKMNAEPQSLRNGPFSEPPLTPSIFLLQNRGVPSHLDTPNPSYYKSEDYFITLEKLYTAKVVSRID